MPRSLLSRRGALRWAASVAALPLAAACGQSAAARAFPVRHSEAEWKRLLTPAQFRILRQKGTEPPGSSPLDHERRKGVFTCAACRNALFSSACKFDSGTGWPSFWKPLPGGVGTSTDYLIGYARTEVHCANCGGHLGHVFPDGPPPTGQRYCMNGAAMIFQPAA